jgi:hypothetical protein
VSGSQYGFVKGIIPEITIDSNDIIMILADIAQDLGHPGGGVRVRAANSLAEIFLTDKNARS